MPDSLLTAIFGHRTAEQQIKPGVSGRPFRLQTVELASDSFGGSPVDVNTFSKRIGLRGRVVSAMVFPSEGSPQRGQTYGTLVITQGGVTQTEQLWKLLRGYFTASVGNTASGNGSIPVDANDQLVLSSKSSLNVTLIARLVIKVPQVLDDSQEAIGWVGTDEDSLSGRGFLEIVQFFNDQTGNVVSSTASLVQTNRIAIYRGLTFMMFTDSANASRSCNVRIRRSLAPSRPTGFTLDEDDWVSPSLSLANGDQGFIHVSSDGRAVMVNDKGVITVADNTTAPSPFPLEVSPEDERVQVEVVVSSGVVGDLFDLFMLREEWIDFGE